MNTTLIFILLGLIVLFLLYKWMNSVDDNSNTDRPIIPKNNTPILSAHKSGGIMGMIYLLYVYPDYTYMVYDKSNDKVKYKGILNEVQRNSVDYLIKVAPDLKTNYGDNQRVCDGLYTGITVGNKEISFGAISRSLPVEVEKNFNNLDKLMKYSKD
jgi:hypothetical protein